MELIVFSDKSHPPEDLALRHVLGVMYDSFMELLDLAASYNISWKYPGTSYGWLIKAEKRRKGLFWLTPLEQAYRIGFILREHELEELKVLSDDPTVVHALDHPARYHEGYGISFLVNDSSLHLPVLHLVTELMSLRENR